MAKKKRAKPLSDKNKRLLEFIRENQPVTFMDIREAFDYYRNRTVDLSLTTIENHGVGFAEHPNGEITIAFDNYEGT